MFFCQEEDEEDALLSPEEILERERKKDPTARCRCLQLVGDSHGIRITGRAWLKPK